MRDEMFFDATIAVSRIAYILSQGNSAADDPFMLYHRGLALTRLQKRLNHETAFAEVEVIFTIGRMLWIAVSHFALVPITPSTLTHGSVYDE